MSTERDFYDHEALRLEGDIGKLHQLRDAQVEHSRLYTDFQAQITDATHALNALRNKIPRARTLDKQVDDAEVALDSAERDLQYAPGTWKRAAAICAVIGGSVFILGLVTMPPLWVTVISLAFIAVAALCGGVSIYSHRRALARVAQAHRELREAELRRADLGVPLPPS